MNMSSFLQNAIGFALFGIGVCMIVVAIAIIISLFKDGI